MANPDRDKIMLQILECVEEVYSILNKHSHPMWCCKLDEALKRKMKMVKREITKCQRPGREEAGNV